MAKQARAFQLNPDDEEIAVPVKAKAETPPAPVAAEAPAETTPKAKWVRPEYRKGRRNLSIWLDEATFNSFKALVALKGTTAQEYVEAMIGREFEKNGWPNPTK